MTKRLITRVKNGKVQQFEQKMKETTYDEYLSIRISSKIKQQLIKFAKDNSYKGYSELVKELIEDLLSKNGYIE